MYRIRIYYPGKTKAKFIKDGISHYLKILKPFAKIEFIELKEGHGEAKKVIEEESKNILNVVKLPFILLHRAGTMIDSLEFAELIREKSSHDFVIGGVYGVNEYVIKAASALLSFSKLTFTHEMCRLLLLEQIYRSMTIISGKKYHY